MFEKETVDAILNGSLLIVWMVAFGLAYYQWRKFQTPRYHCFATPTFYTMHWKAGFRKGYIDIHRASDCYEPKLTRGFNSWHFIVPLDIGYEELADFVKNVEVPEYYVQTDLDMLDAFRDLVSDPDLIRRGSDDDQLVELINHGVVLKHYPDNIVLVS